MLQLLREEEHDGLLHEEQCQDHLLPLLLLWLLRVVLRV
jgi:hypothetical protein